MFLLKNIKIYCIIGFILSLCCMDTSGVTALCSIIGGGILFVILPAIFNLSPPMRRFFVFLNFFQWPLSRHLRKPKELGIEGTRNLYIESWSKVHQMKLVLGVWHVLPSNYLDLLNSKDNVDKDTDDVFDSFLHNGLRPIIIYLHGNTNNRAADYRIKLYKILQKLNYHVITFDYRSYGDSSPLPLVEMGLVEDALTVYNWVLEKIGGKNTPIFFWGHSLGTGVGNHAMALLAKGEHESGIVVPKREANGIILECPFNNFREELEGHILGKIYGWVPLFHCWIVNPVLQNGVEFKSDEHIRVYSGAVLVLQAKDDIIVPYELAVKLLEAGRKRPKHFGPLDMVTFEAKLGHKNIFKAPQLPDIIETFILENSSGLNSAPHKDLIIPA